MGQPFLQYLHKRGYKLTQEIGEGVCGFLAVACQGEPDVSGNHDFWKVDFVALRNDDLCVRYHASSDHEDPQPVVEYFRGGGPTSFATGLATNREEYARYTFTKWVAFMNSAAKPDNTCEQPITCQNIETR